MMKIPAMDEHGVLGKISIVTGASRGIGAATARELAGLGATVVLAARSVDAIGALKDEIISAGGKALAIPTDVTVATEIDRLVSTVGDTFGRIDILVNNAGMLPKARRLEAYSMADWEQVMGTNLSSVWWLSCRAKALMNRGVIVNVLSTASSYPSIGLGPYCVSKCGLAMLTRACALEWARDEIRVVGIAPGKVDTELAQPVIQFVKGRGENFNPMDRLGRPEEIAKAISFLVRGDASFITGAILAVDGGELVGMSSY